MPTYQTDANFTYGQDGEREFALKVEYTYHAAYRDPLRETPDEPAHVDIHSVTGRRWGFDLKTRKPCELGDEIDFSALVCMEDLADEVLREHEGERQYQKELAAEARWEARAETGAAE